jgi:hypothetical protein
MTAEPPSVQISQQELNRLYNAGPFKELIEAGSLIARVNRNGHPSPEKSGQPACTRSQIVRLYDTSGMRIAVLHQYLRPDGTIGASGQPEPKAVLLDGTLYYVQAHP